MQDLRVSIVQAQLAWEDPQRNRDRFSKKLAPLKAQTDLIVLPEMFTTGFSMQSEKLAEGMDGPTVRWMQEQAAGLNAVLTGSIIIKERGRYFNRLLWVQPDGSLAVYDKRHLFTLAGEQQHYTAGNQRLLVDCKDWKVCPLICYDLRFPVWSRNVFSYDLLIYIANFPHKRRHAWKSLLVARAIENQCYTIGVNRVGKDGNDIPYSGDSAVIDFAGRMLCQTAQVENVSTLSLSFEKQKAFRARYAFLEDADDFSIHH